MEKASSRAAAIHCIDPRFRRPVEDLLAEELGLRVDEMTVTSVAGGARDIALGLPGKGLIRFGCEVATGHHGARCIVLVNHQDCGAYGGSSQFTNLLSEIKHHEAELKKAVAYILRKVPNAQEVRGYFAEKNDQVKLRRLV